MDRKFPVDQYGREIKIGDMITYPVRYGGSMWMSTSMVEKIESKPKLGVLFEPTGELQFKLRILSISWNYDKTVAKIIRLQLNRMDRSTILESEGLKLAQEIFNIGLEHVDSCDFKF